MAERIDALTTDGWDGSAIAEVMSLVDSNPLREQFVQQLMRGLHAAGQTADALRAFHRYRSKLAEQVPYLSDPGIQLSTCDEETASAFLTDPTATLDSSCLTVGTIRTFS